MYNTHSLLAIFLVEYKYKHMYVCIYQLHYIHKTDSTTHHYMHMQAKPVGHLVFHTQIQTQVRAAPVAKLSERYYPRYI